MRLVRWVVEELKWEWSIMTRAQKAAEMFRWVVYIAVIYLLWQML